MGERKQKIYERIESLLIEIDTLSYSIKRFPDDILKDPTKIGRMGIGISNKLDIIKNNREILKTIYEILEKVDTNDDDTCEIIYRLIR